MNQLIIIEQYELEKLLGIGSSGPVFLSNCKDDSKKYATKRYERHLIEGKEIKNSIENELNFLQQIDHPNIIKLKDIKKSKRHFYIIYEYCNGGKLSDTLKKYIEKNSNTFPGEIIQHLMKQIIDAFKYLHERKIIHSYIYSDSILLNYENEKDAENLNLMKAQIKITKFKFACKVDKKFLKENIYHKNYPLGFSKRADIWSIGAICYKMLIGNSFVDSKSILEFFEKRNNYIPKTISFEIVSFINGMLQYKANKRLTAEQLSRHDFLNRNVNTFKKINLDIDNFDEGKNLNDNNKITIWSIFNKKDEELLTSILGCDFVKPINENEKLEFSKKEEYSLKLSINSIPGNPIDE